MIESLLSSIFPDHTQETPDHWVCFHTAYTLTYIGTACLLALLMMPIIRRYLMSGWFVGVAVLGVLFYAGNALIIEYINYHPEPAGAWTIMDSSMADTRHGGHIPQHTG